MTDFMNQDMEEKVAGSQGMDKKMWVMLSLLIKGARIPFSIRACSCFTLSCSGCSKLFCFAGPCSSWCSRLLLSDNIKEKLPDNQPS